MSTETLNQKDIRRYGYLNEYNIRNTNNWHVDDSGKDW
jgi:hypothetical protein